LIVAGFFNQGWIKRSPGQIYESESAYNYIQVLEIDGTRYLRLNEGQGMHSQYRPDTLEYGGPWQQFLVAPFFYPGMQPEDVKRIAIVGLAAGTTARQAAAVFPNVVIDGIEIDARIVDVGRMYFDLNLPNLNVIIQDGRWGLESSREKYDLICVDAYRPPYIPPHLTTREFFQAAAQHLVPQGALAVNVGRSPGDRRLINGLATTLRTSFASIYVMDIPFTFNSMLIATLQPTSLADLEQNYTTLVSRPGTPVLLTDSIDLMIKNIQPEPEITQVFTDDKSPIEWITNTMIINFFLEGQMEAMQ
jgi:spermidine synthase